MVGVRKLGLVQDHYLDKVCFYFSCSLRGSGNQTIGWGVTLRPALHVNTMLPAV